MMISDLLLYIVQFTAIFTFLIFCIFVFLPKIFSEQNKVSTYFLKDVSTIRDFSILTSFYAFLFAHLYYYNSSTDFIFYVIGFIFSMCGLFIAIIGRLQLRKLWNPLTNIYDSKEILNSGIFSVLRHPIYAGRFLFFLGVMLMFNLLAILIVPFYWDYLRNRLIKEEKYLSSVNKEYILHMKKVSRVFF